MCLEAMKVPNFVFRPVIRSITDLLIPAWVHQLFLYFAQVEPQGFGLTERALTSLAVVNLLIFLPSGALCFVSEFNRAK